MKCQHNHSDPSDNPSDLHIASCYDAYETYWDRSGLVSAEEFENQPIAERLADVRSSGSRAADDEGDYD
jgi:hypothetical protein